MLPGRVFVIITHMPQRVILLAEDDSHDANAVRDTFISAGITNRVIRTVDGEETIAYLQGVGDFADRKKYPFPAVLLLDLKMPRVDGFQVLAWIREHLPPGELMVVVFSGFDDMSSIKAAYELGADSFLTRPCEPEDVRNLALVHKDIWSRLAETELAAEI